MRYVVLFLIRLVGVSLEMAPVLPPLHPRALAPEGPRQAAAASW